MWINVPYTTSPFAQAEQVSTSDWNWLWEAFARSVGWSGKPSPSNTWPRRWKRAAWLQRLCGRIYRPLMAARGAEQWIASLRATRANPSASPASVVDKMILDTFGRTSVELLARWNRQSCFSKTCPATSASDLTRSPQILKAWVTTLRAGLFTAAEVGASHKRERCSLWRSQTSQQPGVDANKLVTKKGNPATAVDQRLYLNGLHRTVGLPQQVTLWGTPADYSRGGGRSRSGKRIGELLLPGQAKMWTTPRTEERSQHNSRDDHVALSRQVPLWPTPRCSERRPNGPRTANAGRHESQREEGSETPSPDGGTLAHAADEHRRRRVDGEGIATGELWQRGSASNGRAPADSSSLELRVRTGDENDIQQELPSIEQSGLPLFPPGPGLRDAWREILEIDPTLEPAICSVADGMASHRLRLLGNGVVPLPAAYAFVSLWSAMNLQIRLVRMG